MAFATDLWTPDRRAETGDDDAAINYIAGLKKDGGKRIEEREKIRHRLEAEGEFDLAEKLANCGLPIEMVCAHCGEHGEVETHCKRRWCPACAWLVQRKRLERYSGAVKLMRYPAFLTLTIANSPDPESVRKLRKDWAKMRRRKIIAGKVSGGIAAIEVTNKGKGWHPHLHAIIDSKWLAVSTPEPHWTDTPEDYALKLKSAQAELAIIWADTIKQPISVVWIKRCKSQEALVYSLAYAVAGEELVKCPEAIGPLIRVIEKTRLVSAFGNLYGRTAEMDDDEKPCACCKNCGTEKSIVPLSVIYSMVRPDPETLGPSVPFRKGYPNHKAAEDRRSRE